MCLQSYGTAFQLLLELELASLRRVLSRFGADLDGDSLSQILYEYWSHPTLFPESTEVLARCTLPTCLVSNIDNAELESALRHTCVHLNLIVTSEDCRAYKPRGEIFQTALSRLGLAADEVLHVGDSLGSDVRGAKSQGISVLWINRKNRQVPCGEDAPDCMSVDLRGLLRVLQGVA